MIIREATAEDIPAIVTLAQHFLDATPYGALLRAKPHILAHTATLLVQGHGVILLADAPPLVGFLAVYAGPHPFSGELVAEELGWWIEPASRQGTLAYRMLCRIEAWAQAHGATVLKLVAPAGSNLGRHYERRGYTFVESSYQLTFDF